MSTIGYYIPQTLLRHQGIASRTRATLNAWKRVGVDPVLINDAPDWVGGSNHALLNQHLRSDAAAGRRVDRLLTDRDIDHVIARLLLPTHPWAAAAKRGRLSLEIHSPLLRPESLHDLPRVILGPLMGHRLASQAAAAFFITRELQQSWGYRSVAKPLVLGNGVELTAPLHAPANHRLRLGLVVGSTAGWQGIDRFAAWAAALPQHECVVIAPAALEADIRSTLGDGLTLIPTQDSSAYHAALGTLDAAVSGLAYDRRDMAEAAPLKVRDYVNRGIPTVLLYEDTNLRDVQDPAILQLRRWEDLSTLDHWLRSARGLRVREATRQAISIDTIERRRLHHLGVSDLR